MVYGFSHFLRCSRMESPRQAWIPASIRYAPLGILDIFRVAAGAAPQSFFSQSAQPISQWNQSGWKGSMPIACLIRSIASSMRPI